MVDFRLDHLIVSSAERMTADLRNKLTKHPTELGIGREEIIREFLRAHLPKRFDVSTGFVFDAHGNVSKQIDIIIADAGACAHFETAGGTQYFPCESVVAVGEVKSSLTSEKALNNAFDNLESVKTLDRSAGGTAIDLFHGEAIDQQENHLHQVFSFVFVTGKTLAADQIQWRVLEYIKHRDSHLWPNMLLALDRYLVTYACGSGVCPNPMDARGVSLQAPGDVPLLLHFFLLLGRAIEVTRVSRLPYWEYLNGSSIWSASIIHGFADPLPPLLSTLS